MAKKILVVPDVHGRTFWREPVLQMMDEVDRVVFLGDYLDPYKDEDEVYTQEDILQNLEEIVNLKQQHTDKVVLLKGNHDQHYCSRLFREIGGGTRMDKKNWESYHHLFDTLKDLFQLAHLETVNALPYLFTHAGLTAYWLNKVNHLLWKMEDNKISVDDPIIIDKLNKIEDSKEGQYLLAVVGKRRSVFGEKTGSMLWADLEEHIMQTSWNVYGLNKVFQVFGHTRFPGDMADLISQKHFAMIDTQKCFIIDDSRSEKINTIHQ